MSRQSAFPEMFECFHVQELDACRPQARASRTHPPIPIHHHRRDSCTLHTHNQLLHPLPIPAMTSLQGVTSILPNHPFFHLRTSICKRCLSTLTRPASPAPSSPSLLFAQKLLMLSFLALNMRREVPSLSRTCFLKSSTLSRPTSSFPLKQQLVSCVTKPLNPEYLLTN